MESIASFVDEISKALSDLKLKDFASSAGHAPVPLEALEVHMRAVRYVFTDEAISPSHDGTRRAGVSVRLLDDRCFGNGHGSVAAGDCMIAYDCN